MSKVEHQRAFVLHTRSYTDSRIIVELLTRDYGRISGVFRYSSNRRGSFRPQSFLPTLVSYSGKYSLKTVSQLEADGSTFVLKGNALYCGMYLNELLLRLLAAEDSCPDIYNAYESCLNKLQVTPTGDEDIPLRCFELTLLTALGYGIDFSVDAAGEPLNPEDYYSFSPENGFISMAGSLSSECYSGRTLATVADQQWEEHSCRKAAKRLCRVAINELLGDKPLVSRELFKKS